MHVCLVSATMEYGGVERHILALIETLTSQGHRITLLILLNDCLSARLPPVARRIIRVQRAAPTILTSFKQSVALFRSIDADVCVFEKGWFDVGSWGMDLAAKLCFGRYVTIEQLECVPLPPYSTRQYLGGLISGPGLWWQQMRLAGFVRSLHPSAIICVSDAVKKRLLHEYRFPLHKMWTVHNGVDTDRFRIDAERRRQARASWGISAGALVFGAVGRFYWMKAYDLALEAFARLARQHPGRDLRLVLVGGGHEEAALRGLAQSLGLGERIRFYSFTDRPWEVLPGLDVFLMPSLREGLPFALLEAMACGCCPIAMAVGGIAEVLNDPTAGWLIPAGNRERFSTALESAMRLSVQDRVDMGRKARERVCTRFDERVQLEKTVRLIRGERIRRT